MLNYFESRYQDKHKTVLYREVKKSDNYREKSRILICVNQKLEIRKRMRCKEIFGD
jgi:hypothetical protein